MDGTDTGARLRRRLAGIDWSRGTSKPEIASLVADDPVLAALVDTHLADRQYLTLDDVLVLIPNQPASGAPEHPAASTAAAAAPGGGAAPGSATETGQPVIVGSESDRGKTGAEPIRDAASRTTEAIHEGRGQVEEVAAKVGDVTEPLLDQVPSPGGKTKQGLIAAGLSWLLEGLGQAYNRQPAKATVFVLIGLTLSSVSGLNTWIVRNVFRVKNARMGAKRVHPVLLGLWFATALINMWDAWQNAVQGPECGRPTNRSASGRSSDAAVGGTEGPSEIRGRVDAASEVDRRR